jgi:hypothetical protein
MSRRYGLFDDEIEFDETNKKHAKRIKAFLKEYRALCRKHGCLVTSDGADVEVVPSKALANESDPWGVEECTRERGWKI